MAIGNSAEAGLLPSAERLRDGPDPVVTEVAAWAWDRLTRADQAGAATLVEVMGAASADCSAGLDGRGVAPAFHRGADSSLSGTEESRWRHKMYSLIRYHVL